MEDADARSEGTLIVEFPQEAGIKPLAWSDADLVKRSEKAIAAAMAAIQAMGVKMHGAVAGLRENLEPRGLEFECANAIYRFVNEQSWRNITKRVNRLT